MFPKKFAPALFGLILSRLMSLLVSGISTYRAAGFGDGYLVLWTGAWLTAWLVAFPVVLVVAPLARRAVSALVEDRSRSPAVSDNSLPVGKPHAFGAKS